MSFRARRFPMLPKFLAQPSAKSHSAAAAAAFPVEFELGDMSHAFRSVAAGYRDEDAHPTPDSFSVASSSCSSSTSSSLAAPLHIDHLHDDTVATNNINNDDDYFALRLAGADGLGYGNDDHGGAISEMPTVVREARVGTTRTTHTTSTSNTKTGLRPPFWNSLRAAAAAALA
ncbi:hypothetical protein HDU86_000012 [Geranomyces michiganensis]|nr:hypothetical protein HDU86_000012 [Geranomyces michiganensis]